MGRRSQSRTSRRSRRRSRKSESRQRSRHSRRQRSRKYESKRRYRGTKPTNEELTEKTKALYIHYVKSTLIEEFGWMVYDKIKTNMTKTIYLDARAVKTFIPVVDKPTKATVKLSITKRPGTGMLFNTTKWGMRIKHTPPDEDYGIKSFTVDDENEDVDVVKEDVARIAAVKLSDIFIGPQKYIQREYMFGSNRVLRLLNPHFKDDTNANVVFTAQIVDSTKPAELRSVQDDNGYMESPYEKLMDGAHDAALSILAHSVYRQLLKHWSRRTSFNLERIEAWPDTQPEIEFTELHEIRPELIVNAQTSAVAYSTDPLVFTAAFNVPVDEESVDRLLQLNEYSPEDIGDGRMSFTMNKNDTDNDDVDRFLYRVAAAAVEFATLGISFGVQGSSDVAGAKHSAPGVKDGPDVATHSAPRVQAGRYIDLYNAGVHFIDWSSPGSVKVQFFGDSELKSIEALKTQMSRILDGTSSDVQQVFKPPDVTPPYFTISTQEQNVEDILKKQVSVAIWNNGLKKSKWQAFVTVSYGSNSLRNNTYVTFEKLIHDPLWSDYTEDNVAKFTDMEGKSLAVFKKVSSNPTGPPVWIRDPGFPMMPMRRRMKLEFMI